MTCAVQVICCGEEIERGLCTGYRQVDSLSGVYHPTEFRDRRRFDLTTGLLPFEGPWRIGRIPVKNLTTCCEEFQEYHLNGIVTVISARKKDPTMYIGVTTVSEQSDKNT